MAFFEFIIKKCEIATMRNGKRETLEKNELVNWEIINMQNRTELQISKNIRRRFKQNKRKYYKKNYKKNFQIPTWPGRNLKMIFKKPDERNEHIVSVKNHIFVNVSKMKKKWEVYIKERGIRYIKN